MNKRALLISAVFTAILFVCNHLSADTGVIKNINSFDYKTYDILSISELPGCMAKYNDRQIICKRTAFKPEIFESAMKCIDEASVVTYFLTSCISICPDNIVKQCSNKEVKGLLTFLILKTRK